MKGPNGVSLGGGQPSPAPAGRPFRRSLRPLALAAGATVVGSAVYMRGKDHRELLRPPLWIPLTNTFIEATAGGVGEIVQIAVLYPLDTLKVRCQAAGISAKQVISQWVQQRITLPALVQQLYAGALIASCSSIFIGGLHYACFCSTRRWLLTFPIFGGAQQQPVPGSGTPSTSSHSSHSSSTAHIVHSHGALGTHYMPLHEQPGTADGEDAGTSSNEDGRTVVNLLSAMLTAVVTAAIEAPVELFRHNAQAGMFKGSFLSAMVQYCFESWPYDVAELLVVAGLKDMQPQLMASLGDGPVGKAAAALPADAFDVLVGAAAGLVAVVVSMPPDAIKVYMQTRGIEAANANIIGSAATFWRTGVDMVKQRGPGALYVGIMPRLAYQVPSAVLCWWTIGAIERVMGQWAKEQRRQKALEVAPLAS